MVGFTEFTRGKTFGIPNAVLVIIAIGAGFTLLAKKR